MIRKKSKMVNIKLMIIPRDLGKPQDSNFTQSGKSNKEIMRANPNKINKSLNQYNPNKIKLTEIKLAANLIEKCVESSMVFWLLAKKLTIW